MATDESTEALNAARFSAYCNGSYHADRESVLDRRHRWMMFLVVTLGASQLASIAASWMHPLFGLASALVGATDLAFGFSVRARNHAYLRKEYFRVAAALAEGNCKPSKAEAKMIELAAEEEPIFRGAHAIAENWATTAVYGKEKPLPCEVKLFARIFRHWLHMTQVNFSKK